MFRYFDCCDIAILRFSKYILQLVGTGRSVVKRRIQIGPYFSRYFLLFANLAREQVSQTFLVNRQISIAYRFSRAIAILHWYCDIRWAFGVRISRVCTRSNVAYLKLIVSRHDENIQLLRTNNRGCVHRNRREYITFTSLQFEKFILLSAHPFRSEVRVRSSLYFRYIECCDIAILEVGCPLTRTRQNDCKTRVQIGSYLTRHLLLLIKYWLCIDFNICIRRNHNENIHNYRV